MTEPRDSRSLADLISDLTQQVSTLVSTESKLLRAELSEKISQFGTGAGELVGGAICLLAALVVLLQALVIALARTGMGPGWASLLVGLVVAALGFVLLQSGRAKLKPSNLTPERTQGQLASDARIVKEQMK